MNPVAPPPDHARPSTDETGQHSADSHPVGLARLLGVRAVTESLASPLSAEDQTAQSMPDVSPTKWHRAHTTWFFETFILGEHDPGYTPFDHNYAYLFNSYYVSAGERYPRPNRGLVTRPGAEEIGRYRRYVDTALGSMGERLFTSEVGDLTELGIHHEQQHQELLLMDIKHVLANNQFDTAYRPAPPLPPSADPGPSHWVPFTGGSTTIGIDPNRGAGFNFDNEGPQHQVLVPDFSLADRLVTCGEWLEFMANGGYQQPLLWLSDGWYRRQSDGWDAPLYWQQTNDGGWRVHTLTGWRPVDVNEPVCHVSYYEADAFATWAGARLPTEFEWEHAALGCQTSEQASPPAASVGELLRYLPDGQLAATNRYHPSPATPTSPAATGPATPATPPATPNSPAATGPLRQLVGDCWEWTASAYHPYPGFQAADGAIGEYNGKFMVNQMVLRGGCALTPHDHVRPTYRNFFYPHTRWHLSGVRLAR